MPRTSDKKPKNPQVCQIVAKHIQKCLRFAEGQPLRKEMVKRVKDHREQHDATYKLKQKTKFSNHYQAVIAADIEKGRGVLQQDLKQAYEIVKVRPSHLRLAQEVQKKWDDLENKKQSMQTVVQALTGDTTEWNIERDKIEAYRDVTSRLNLEATLQELRTTHLAKASGVDKWIPDGYWSGCVDGTVEVRIGWDDREGKSPKINLVDCLDFYPARSDLSTLEEQPWVIEIVRRTGAALKGLAGSEEYALIDSALETSGELLDSSGRDRKRDMQTDAPDQLSKVYEAPAYTGALDLASLFPETAKRGEAYDDAIRRFRTLFNWPDDFDPDSVDTWYAEAQGDVLIRLEPSPFTYAKFPYIHFKLRERKDGGFWGSGLYDLGADEGEKAYNFKKQLYMMGMWKAQDPPLAVDQGALDPNYRFNLSPGGCWDAEPGKLFVLRAPGGVGQAVMPLAPEAPSIELAMSGMNFDLSEMRNQTGITASVRGQSKAGTATEAKINLEQGIAGLGALGARIDSEFIHPVLEMLYAMARALWPETMPATVNEQPFNASFSFPTHTFEVVIVQAAANRALQAQILNNVAGVLGPYLEPKAYLRAISVQLQQKQVEGLLDEDMVRLKRVQTQIQLIQAEQQLKMLTKPQPAAPQLPGPPGAQPPGQPQPQMPQPQNGNGGQPDFGLMNQNMSSRIRSRSAPTNEMNLENQAIGAQTRQMNPAMR